VIGVVLFVDCLSEGGVGDPNDVVFWLSEGSVSDPNDVACRLSEG